MNHIVHIIRFMGELGARFPTSDLPAIMNYVGQMVEDGRVSELRQDGNLIGYIFYSLCSDLTPYYKKPTWEYVAPSSGNTLYVEKLVCTTWNKEIRRSFEDIITKKYPTIEYAIWHRWGKRSDRRVIYRRKLCTK